MPLILNNGKFLITPSGRFATSSNCCCGGCCEWCDRCPLRVRVTMRADGICQTFGSYDGLFVEKDVTGPCRSELGCRGMGASLYEFDLNFVNFQWWTEASISFFCLDGQYVSVLRGGGGSPCLSLGGLPFPVVEKSCTPFRLVSVHYSGAQGFGNCAEPCGCGGLFCDPGDFWFEVDEI